jgi:hypothetical protein
MLLPALGRVAEKYASFEGRRRSALTAIAVERRSLAAKGVPLKKLEELVPTYLPEVPVDPFDGKPLRFRQLESGFVIYSVGKDRQDDEGKERTESGSKQNYDETFIVQPAPQPGK